jgi:hypothetical protein
VAVLSVAYAVSTAQALGLWLKFHLEQSSLRSFCVFDLYSLCGLRSLADFPSKTICQMS